MEAKCGEMGNLVVKVAMRGGLVPSLAGGVSGYDAARLADTRNP